MADELATGRDAELSEYLAQVVLDRARTEEQLGGDLAVGQALRNEPGYLRLLRCQLIER